MNCILCGREEGKDETRGDHVRFAHAGRDGKFAKGYYMPRYLSQDEMRVVRNNAPGDVAICNNRENCRKRFLATSKAKAVNSK